MFIRIVVIRNEYFPNSPKSSYRWHDRSYLIIYAPFCSSYLYLRTVLLLFRKKEVTFVYQKLLLFLSKPLILAYHRRTKCGAYHQGRQADLVSHHASACISLRLDEIQHFVLMIYRNKLRMIYKASP